LRKEYDRIGADYDGIFEGIRDVIIKTIISVENPIITSMGGSKFKTTSFEVYGFDILIDQ
jgi:Tubulin-tyrosine ligase family